MLRCIDEIANMPYWCAKGRLDAWEQRVQDHEIDWDARDASRAPLFSLAIEIFELERHNLYSRIDHRGTIAEFRRVRLRLQEAGVSGLPDASEFDFGTW